LLFFFERRIRRQANPVQPSFVVGSSPEGRLRRAASIPAEWKLEQKQRRRQKKLINIC